MNIRKHVVFKHVYHFQEAECSIIMQLMAFRLSDYWYYVKFTFLIFNFLCGKFYERPNSYEN